MYPTIEKEKRNNGNAINFFFFLYIECIYIL